MKNGLRPCVLHSTFFILHSTFFIYLFFILHLFILHSSFRNSDIFRIKSFYFPFLLFVVPICLLHNVFYELGLYEKDYDLKQYAVQIIRCFSFSIGTNEPWLQQLWFLKTLFLAEVFYALIGYITNKFKICLLYTSPSPRDS